MVAGLLAIFALSIPAWGIHQIIARWFYAHRRMWLPVLIGTGATVVAIPATLLAADRWGAAGVAGASTAVMWVYTAAMALAWFASASSRRFVSARCPRPGNRPCRGRRHRRQVGLAATGV